MLTENRKRLLRIFGYIAFVLFTFLFFVYQTFPYELLIQRLTMEQQRRARMRIQIERVKPYWLSGVQALGVNLRTMVKKGTAEIHVDAATVRLSLLSLLVGNINAAFSSEVARGTIKGEIHRNSKRIKAELEIDNLQLASLGPTAQAMRQDKQAKPLLSMLFAPIYGRLTGKVDVEIPSAGAAPPPRNSNPRTNSRNTRGRRNARNRRPVRPAPRPARRLASGGMDLLQSQGTVKINIKGLSLGPGYFPTQSMGEVPVPLLRLGNFLLQVKLNRDRVDIIKGVSVGEDGELHINGFIQLRPRLDYSSFRGTIKFKINKAFEDRKSTPSLLKAALSVLGPSKGGFHSYRVYLPFRGRPTFTKQ